MQLRRMLEEAYNTDNTHGCEAYSNILLPAGRRYVFFCFFATFFAAAPPVGVEERETFSLFWTSSIVRFWIAGQCLT
jgi:hypothetical protein